MESILTTIKKLLGIEESYEQFDTDILIGINASIGTLRQLGMMVPAGFVVYDKNATWQKLLNNRKDLDFVITFIHLHTRLIFDPPQNAFLVKAIQDQLEELTWRINVAAEAKDANASVGPSAATMEEVLARLGVAILNGGNETGETLTIGNETGETLTIGTKDDADVVLIRGNEARATLGEDGVVVDGSKSGGRYGLMVNGNSKFSTGGDYDVEFTNQYLAKFTANGIYGGWVAVDINNDANGAGGGLRLMHKGDILTQIIVGAPNYPFSEGLTFDVTNGKVLTFALRRADGWLKFTGGPTKGEPYFLAFDRANARLVVGDGNDGSLGLANGRIEKRVAGAWVPFSNVSVGTVTTTMGTAGTPAGVAVRLNGTALDFEFTIPEGAAPEPLRSEPFTDDDARWSAAVNDIYTLTVPHTNAYAAAVFKQDGAVYSQVSADIQRDNTNVMIRTMDKFSGYVLMGATI